MSFGGNPSNPFQKYVTVTSGGENVEKQRPSHTAAGNTKRVATVDEEFGSSSKTQTYSQYDPEFPLLEIQHRELRACVRAHAQSSSIPNSQMWRPQCPSTDRGTNKCGSFTQRNSLP